MSSLGNGRFTFRVSISHKVANHLKQILENAEAAGMLDEFISALKEINQRLQNDPEVFGEQLYFLKAMALHVRLGAIWPLSVTFGVNIAARLVFLGTVKSLKDFD